MAIFILIFIVCIMVAIIFQKTPTETKSNVKITQNSTSKDLQSQTPNNLVFKDNQSAFEYACEFMDCTLQEGARIPALVIDAPDKRDENGNQSARIKVASKEGGFFVTASTIHAPMYNLKSGGFVCWQAFEPPEVVPVELEHLKHLLSGFFSWSGWVVAKLEPVLDIQNGWKVTN